jgi:hypothetical protein
VVYGFRSAELRAQRQIISETTASAAPARNDVEDYGDPPASSDTGEQHADPLARIKTPNALPRSLSGAVSAIIAAKCLA